MKPTATIITMPVAARLECSQCGASGEGSCGCGMPYVPAGTRAATALAKNPEMSDRAIADEIGIGKDTVRRVRKKQGGAYAPPDKRIGRDNKIYPAKPKPAEPSYVVVGGEPMSRRNAKRITRKLSAIETLAMRQQINSFTRELSDFEDEFVPRLTAWREVNPDIEKDGRNALVMFLTNFATRFQLLAQKINE